jgi:hypothetical protein
MASGTSSIAAKALARETLPRSGETTTTLDMFAIRSL